MHFNSFQVFTEGHFAVEFNFDNLLRIRHWIFDIKQHQEMVPRSVLNSDDDALEKITKNITRQGLTNFTMNYLRVGVVSVSERGPAKFRNADISFHNIDPRIRHFAKYFVKMLPKSLPNSDNQMIYETPLLLEIELQSECECSL